MKTLSMLLLSLAGLFLPGGLNAQESGDSQVDRPAVRRFGFEVGLTSYSPNFTGLTTAYTHAEDQYRNQGYSITPHSPAIDVTRLLTFALRFRPSVPIGVLLETGTSLDNDRLDFKAVSAALLYFPPVGWKSVEPYAGAGIGRYRFSTTRTYGEGNRISPDLGGGSYTYLDRIESKGGGVGSTLTIGMNLHKSSSPIGLGAFASYLVMLGSVEGAMPDGHNVEVDLNTLMVGGRLLVDL